MNWHAIVWVGRPRISPPRGVYRSREEAEHALALWRSRVGHLAGTLESVHNVRIQGPYSSRARARAADISEVAS